MTNPREAVALKPCPFCGGCKYLVLKATCHKSTPYDPEDRMNPIVRCLTCYAEVSGRANDGPRDIRETKSAVEAWNTRAAISAMGEQRVKPLVWDIDGRELRLDDQLLMGHGYDWDGYELMREEAYGAGANYMIWPDHISSDLFSLYCTLDGLYVQSLTKEAAKAKADNHHAALFSPDTRRTHTTRGRSMSESVTGGIKEHGVAVIGLLMLKQIAEKCQECDPDQGALIEGKSLYEILEWHRQYLNAVESALTPRIDGKETE